MTSSRMREIEEGREAGELGEDESKSSSEEEEEEEEERGKRFDTQAGSGKDDGGVDDDEGSVEEERHHLGPIGGRWRFSHPEGVEQEDGEVDEDEEDVEANEDLSLLIVEKAKKRQKVEASPPDEGIVFVDDRVGRGAGKELNADLGSTGGNSVGDQEECKDPLKRCETPEEGELQEDDEGNFVPAEELFEVEDIPDGGKKRKKKKEKKEKKKKKKGGDHEQNKGKSHRTEVKLIGAEESIVMRKLLRGPRYFDPPEEQDQSCFNCGKVGHLAVDCAGGPRLKPCYVCGAFGHDGRDCPQKTDCYICGKVGHIAKNCPNKGIRTPTSRRDEIICLLCGRSGHERSTCYYDYDEQDLQQVQCYICKEFGHLSCLNIVDTSPVPISCYMCGEMGHTGTECSRTRRSDRDKDRDRPPSLCFRCGEEGHFARECSKQRRGPWPPPWSPGDTFVGGDYTTPNAKHQRRNGVVPRWMDLQSRETRWTPSARPHPLDPLAGSRGGGTSSNRKDPSDHDQDYMGPIENFIDNPKENFKPRRRKSWAAGGGRKRS